MESALPTELGASFLDVPGAARRAWCLDAVYRPSERVRKLVDRMPHMRLQCHKLAPTILALYRCGSVLPSGWHVRPWRILLFFLRPLPICYRLAGVGCFYGGVHHAQVVARSVYGPVHGVPVVDAQQVMAAVTLGHVAVVCVSSGVEVVMTALGDHPVWHSVADPLEEDLVGSRCDAGLGLALDHPSYHLLGQCRAGAAHQRCEHYRKRQHHRYPLFALLKHHLFPSFALQGARCTRSLFAPL